MSNNTELAVVEQHGQAQLAPVFTMNDMWRMAQAFAISKLFGIETPEQALSLCLIAQAEGLHPAIAARDYHIIKGRPALKSDAMLARFQAAGGRVEWTCLTDQRVAAKFTHAQGGSVEIDWDMARAKQAGLGGKDNWRNYPRQMLRARVISEGIRTVYPGAIGSMYTPEEVIEFEPRREQPTPRAAQSDYIITEAQPADPAVVGQQSTPTTTPQAGSNASRSDATASEEKELGDAVAGGKPGNGGAEQQTQPAASSAASHPDDVQPPKPAPVQEIKHGLPVGQLFTAKLGNGQKFAKQGKQPYYVWLATNQLSGEQAYVYCYHLNQPVTATGITDPEHYIGEVQMLLSQQHGSRTNPDTGEAESFSWYRVEQIQKAVTNGRN